MNLLFVIHYPVFGGPHNRAMRLAPVLAGRGVTTTVLLPSTPGNAAERLRAAGVDVIAMPLHRIRATASPVRHLQLAAHLWPEVQAIRRVIRERSIGVVQVGGLVNPHAAIAARLEGVPVVWQLLDTRPPIALRRLVMPLVARLADSVMLAGGALVGAHPGAAALSARSFVFYPPVDTRSYCPDRADQESVRTELGITPSAPVVGAVANVNPQKGHEYFVQAAALIKRRHPDARFIIAGAFYETHSGYADRIRDLARDLAVSDAIVFTGHREDTQRMFRAMDVCVLASVPRSEGAPTAAQESLAVGTPVVATDVGAVAEVVDDGMTGYVVPPLDAHAIARATLRILHDPALRERMSHAGRLVALDRFSVEQCARAHLDAYDCALRRRGHQTPDRGRERASLSQANPNSPRKAA
jgi:glycosyltransferase involved in cell wall biosynthesis